MTQSTDKNYQPATKQSKSVIITGATSGLGYCCAEAIARSGQDWHIIIASRNLLRVEEAVRNLMAETKYPHIEGMEIDLASLASVHQFTQDFVARSPLQAIVAMQVSKLFPTRSTQKMGLK